jgi:hypothetical protein
MSAKKKKKSITSHLIAFMAGVIVTSIINVKIEDYFKRPKISSSIDCINIVDNEENELVLNLYMQFENLGQTNTSVTIDKCEIQFNGIHDKPYVFNVSERIKISALSYSYDTIKIVLPKSFDTITEIPTLQLLSLRYHELKRKKQLSISKDSTDVLWRFMGGTEELNSSDTLKNDADYIVNNGQVKITGRKIPILFKGKTYDCLMYPRDAYVSYKVEDDKIHLIYGREIKMPPAINGIHDFILKPLIFIPAPEIEDKCVLPKGYVFSMRQEQLENDKIKFKEYSVNIKDLRYTRKQIVFFLN